MDKYDVVIIGGGPAGATAGYLLAKNGFSTAIVDSMKFPRPKLCAGGITSKTKRVFEKIFDFKMEDLAVSDSDHVNFFFGGRRISSVDGIPLHFVDRGSFDHELIKRFVSVGGVLHENERVRRKDIGDDFLRLRSGEKIGFSVLIGADGALSEVRKLMEPKYKPSGFCVELEVPSKERLPKAVDLYLDTVKIGYLWDFPSKNGRCLGIGADMSEAKMIKPKLIDFMKKHSCYDPAIKIKGAMIPFKEYVKVDNFKEKVLLIGDAGGLVDPVTGEGLYFAACSGLFAFEAVRACLRDGESLPQTYQGYVKYIHRIIDLMAFARHKLYFPLIRKILLNTLGRQNWFMRRSCNRILDGFSFKGTARSVEFLLKKHCR